MKLNNYLKTKIVSFLRVRARNESARRRPRSLSAARPVLASNRSHPKRSNLF